MPRNKRKPTKRLYESNDNLLNTAKKSKKRLKYKDPREGITHQVQFSCTEYPYRLGNIIIKYNNDIEENLPPEFSIEFKPESICCLLLEENESEKKVLQASYETPFNIVECLASINIFYFITNSNTLQPGENIIKVCLNPSVFISLKSASEPYFNHQRHQMYRILQYFLDIEFDEYDEDYLYDEEQVAKIYSCFTNSYEPNSQKSVVTHQFLIPELRPYQCQAVSWMLKCEMENSIDTSEVDLHQLYTAITLVDGHIVYFHKYGGFFVKQKFVPDNLCKGGILADEMGLGKTLEVLACILLNPRNPVEIQNCENYSQEKTKKSILVKENQNSKQLMKKKAPNSYDKYCENNEEVEFFEYDENFGCVCGAVRIEHRKKRSKSLVMCIECNIFQHADCVMYNSSDISEEDYICPFCCIDNTDHLPSRATLIISPASILHQWEQEILKHVNENCLKVFMYHGVENQRFVHPSFLANHDIVLVSYETLKKELTHVDVPYGSAGHSLRYIKKFITIPSPMCCVQWWRVCLDEAQMVESVSSKVAKMAGKLVCVNRWCVTGTPIKKSVEDLYGLFLFLNINPYQKKMWWKEVIWKPFVNGNIGPLSSSLKNIAWRTMKHQVSEQLGVPDLMEVIHKLEFSPIERVYYLKQHSLCKADFMEKVIKFEDLNVKLCSLDRHVLSKIMLPLKRLQLVCCHFQITRANVEVQKLSKMTTTELLAHLLKTTKYECEDVHRKLIMAMNGLAGIFSIQKDFENAIETFEKALHSIEDNKQNIRTDITQHIHAAYHLSKILLELEKEGKCGNSSFTIEELNAKVDELSQSYIDKHKLTLDVFSKNIEEINEEISQIKSKFKVKEVEYPISAWWAAIFENMTYKQKETFLGKLIEMLDDAPGKSYLRGEKIPFMIRNGCFSDFTFAEFLAKLFDLTKDLHDTRKKLKDKINQITVEPSASTLDSAISCHLRPTPYHDICIYCQTEDMFKTYETKLFRFDETKQATNEDETKQATNEESVCFQNSRRGTHADSDLELVLKFLLNYSRRTFKGSSKMNEKFQIITDCNEDGANELKLLDALKKEFKILRNVWKKCVDYASQKDEVEMAKIAARLPLPGELPQTPPASFIVHPEHVQPKKVQYHSDIVCYQFELKKKLGQLFYLQNLERAENKNAPFEENCPICQQMFESSWSVLQCGHCLCLLCIEQLLSSKKNFTNSLGYIFQGIRCPLCREFTAASDVYFIENHKQEDIAVKGFYSTKTNAVVKCLLEINNKDPKAKSIVFSSFVHFLYILENALKENGIKFFNFCKRKRFQEQLEQFKNGKEVNILLVPLNFGCNGLNITEATNVLLLEPVLDTSKELQAIGRVHRIGQKKTATVHRFVISDSIEENLCDIMKKSTSDDKCKTDITLQSLKDLFKET